MKFIFYSPDFGPAWDYTSVEHGLGGSETYHVEMALRLAARGHEVDSYNNLAGAACVRGGVHWRDLHSLRTITPYGEHKGTWIIQRQPEFIDRLAYDHLLDGAAQQRFWHVYHDVDYPTATLERMARYDRLIALSPFHAEYLRNQEHRNVSVGQSGIASDRMEALPHSDSIRNPRRLIYSSTPDRGLEHLLKSFARAREQVEDLELHCFYGWEGFDARIARDVTGECARQKAAIVEGLKQPGVTWHGRVGQTELWREFLKSGIWCYQTEFFETACITAMEAQALGAVPIFNPLWALQDNVFAGISIEGDCWRDRLVKARFAYEIVKLARSPEAQENMRAEMMPIARERFSWDRACEQFEAMAAEDLGERVSEKPQIDTDEHR